MTNEKFQISLTNKRIFLVKICKSPQKWEKSFYLNEKIKSYIFLILMRKTKYLSIKRSKLLLDLS